MKKIIEVLILIGGLIMIVSCANPSSISDDTYSQNTNNTEVQNGGGTTDDSDDGSGGTIDPQNTNIINGVLDDVTFKITVNGVIYNKNNNNKTLKINENDILISVNGILRNPTVIRTIETTYNITLGYSNNSITVKINNKDNGIIINNEIRCFYNTSNNILYIENL